MRCSSGAVGMWWIVKCLDVMWFSTADSDADPLLACVPTDGEYQRRAYDRQAYRSRRRYSFDDDDFWQRCSTWEFDPRAIPLSDAFRYGSAEFGTPAILCGADSHVITEHDLHDIRFAYRLGK